MKNFSDNAIHVSATDTVLKKLTKTILTKGNTVRFSDPGNLERFLSLVDNFLMDRFLTPSFVVDKFEDIFGYLGYYIQCEANFVACFLFGKVFYWCCCCFPSRTGISKWFVWFWFCQIYARCKVSFVRFLSTDSNIRHWRKRKISVNFVCRTQ